jgi:hypothetical protein
MEVAVTEAAELIPVRRVALRSSLGNDDTTVMKRRYSSPAHIPDHQPSSGVSSSYASNSNSYCTTDDDELSYTSESYYSTDEESGSVEDLASPLYHGKLHSRSTAKKKLNSYVLVCCLTHISPGSEIGSWHSSGESLLAYLPGDLSLNAAVIAGHVRSSSDTYYDIKSDDEYYSTFTVVSSRRKRNRNRQKVATSEEAEAESETHSENEVEADKEGGKGRGRGRRRKAVIKRSKSQECCSRKEVDKSAASPAKKPTTPTASAATTTSASAPDESPTSRGAVRTTRKSTSKSLPHEVKRSAPAALFREKVSGILNRSAPSFSAIVKGLTEEKGKGRERPVFAVQKEREGPERKETVETTTTLTKPAVIATTGSSSAVAKDPNKVMTYSEVVNRKESGGSGSGSMPAVSVSVSVTTSTSSAPQPAGVVQPSSSPAAWPQISSKEERTDEEKRAAVDSKGKERIYDDVEEDEQVEEEGEFDDDEGDESPTEEEEQLVNEATKQLQLQLQQQSGSAAGRARIRPIPMPFTNLNIHAGRMTNSSPPSPSSHSTPPSPMINSLLPLSSLSPPSSPDVIQRRTRAR